MVFFESFIEILIYSNLAMFNILGQYFYFCGFTPFEIGILIATIPASSIISNPFWFKRKLTLDRNRMVWYLFLGSAFCFWMVFLLPSFWLKFLFMIFTAFFSTSIVPISESYVMESLIEKKERLDIPRMFGTVGYSMSSLGIGFLLKTNLFSLFLFSTIFMFVNVFLIRKLSLYKAVDSFNPRFDQKREGSWKFFLSLLSVAVASMVLISFNGTFLPKLIGDRHYDSSIAGICYAVLSFSEVPFLLFARKILKKLGTLFLVSSGAFLLAIRFLLTPYTSSEITLILLQMIHGWNYIVIYYSIYNYIHYELPKEYSSKAQTVFWIGILGLGFLVGSSLGGWLVERLGIESSYTLLGFCLLVPTAPLFVVALVKRMKKKTL